MGFTNTRPNIIRAKSIDAAGLLLLLVPREEVAVDHRAVVVEGVQGAEALARVGDRIDLI